MEQVKVSLGERSYPIYLGNAHLDSLPALLAGLRNFSRMVIVTDQNVDYYYGEQIYKLLREAGIAVNKLVIAGGETNKNLTTVESICQQMVELGCDRESMILALGGGIVGDIAGFAASSYMRGISYVQVPTSLLAQVDSSVGGKTGVNLPGGKNLIGAFCQPQMVFIDVSLLKTLNEREFLTGLAEVIKYCIIKDADLFTLLEQNRSQILAREASSLLPVITRCCSIKAEIVARDEKESGERALLNLGHTFGHAIETVSNFTYNHGEAVAAGTVYASRLAVKYGVLGEDDCQRIEHLIADYGLPVSADKLETRALLAAMYHDKKNRFGQLQLVLPTRIGQAIITSVPDQLILDVLDKKG